MTWNRVEALKTIMNSLDGTCPFYDTAVFEDCGSKDDTRGWLKHGRVSQQSTLAESVEASYFSSGDGTEVYLGDRNLGVSGNSNRAIKWFMESDNDHLLLCNDDVEATGDFAAFYAKAHEDLGIGLFCFCDFTSDAYKWSILRSKGYQIKDLSRMTGIMMSMTRRLVESIGYFDVRFGKFGEEHCDYTHRARFAGFSNVDRQQRMCLDVVHQPKPLLKSQNVQSTVTGLAKQEADRIAILAMDHAKLRYKTDGFYRPFKLRVNELAGGRDGCGIRTENLQGYKTVTDY